METDMMEQRAFLHALAEQLRPWWQHLGTIDQLVVLFVPGGSASFQNHQAFSPVHAESGESGEPSRIND